MRWNELTVDLSVVKRNYEYLKSITKAEVACTIKSDGYGIVIKECANLFLQNGCKTFFVAHIDEGIEVRNLLGNNANVYVLHGVVNGEEKDFLAHKLIPVINNEYQFNIWENFAIKKQILLEYALHIDTGINRL